jgi:hypothetical protein
MPRFNIFKALVGRTSNSYNQSKSTDRSLPDQSSNIPAPNVPSLPSKKAKTLTKRRPPGRQQSQPSYNVQSADIGYHELGRYPKNLPEPAVRPSVRCMTMGNHNCIVTSSLNQTRRNTPMTIHPLKRQGLSIPQ